MLINNKIIERKKAGEQSLGTFSLLGDKAVDAISYTGMDYVIMDTEHSTIDDTDLEIMIALAAARGYSPVVRIKETNRTSVLRAFDSGAHAIIVPNLKTVEQAKKLVEWGKFMPIGERGLSETRDGGFALGEQMLWGTEKYMAYCNENTLILPQCETKECLESLEEIMAIDGIDGIFVGPYDLSLSLGIPVQFDNPIFTAAIDKVLATCKANGKLAVIYADDAETANMRYAQGFDSVTSGLDVVALQNAYVEMVKNIRG